MATHWYLFKNEKQLGPFSGRQIKELALLGKLGQDDLVQKGSDGSPVPAKKVQGLFGPDKFADQRPMVPNSLASSSHEPTTPPPLPPTSHQPKSVTASTISAEVDAEAHEQLTGSNAKPSSSFEPPTPPPLPPPAIQPETLTASRRKNQPHQKEVAGTNEPSASIEVAAILDSLNVYIGRFRDWCKGVYLGFRENMFPKNNSDDSEITDHSSFTDRLKETASGLLGTAKAAGQLAAAQSKKTKLSTIDLPASYLALGRLVLQSGRYTEQFPEEHKQIKKLDKEIANYNVRTESEGSELKQKMQAGADNVKKAGLLKATQLKRDSLLRELGKKSYAAELKDAAFAGAFSKISEISREVDATNSTIQGLEVTSQGKFITPKRLLVATVAFAGLLLIGLMVPSAENDDLPNELRIANSNGGLALESIVNQLRPLMSDFKIYPELEFSRNGKYLLATDAPSDGPPRRPPLIWNTQTGKKVEARDGKIDYFSGPAAFSPDERAIVCLDGDYIRIWSLQNDHATLLFSLDFYQALSETEAPPKFDGYTAPEIYWNDSATILVTERKFVAFALRKTGSSDFDLILPKQRPFSDSRENQLTFSPDAKYIVAGLQPQEFTSGKLLDRLETKAGNGFFGVKANFDEIWPNTNYAMGHDGCVTYFTPDGSFLLAFSSSGITGFDTSDWSLSAEIACEFAGQIGYKRNWQRAFDGKSGSKIVLGYSPDTKNLALVSGAVKRTSQKMTVQYRLHIYNMRTGALVSEVALGEDFSELFGFGNFAFVDGGKRAVLCLSTGNENGVNHWTVGSWTVEDGKRNWVVSRADEEPERFKISPDGKALSYITGRGQTLKPVDIDATVAVQSSLNEGDKQWAARDLSAAFDGYAKVISNPANWFFGEGLARAYSRTIDFYAANSDAAKIEAIVDSLEGRKVNLKPETIVGQSMLNKIVIDREAERRRIAGKQMEELRKRNSEKYIPATGISKKEFIAKMRDVMSYGRLDNNFTHAIFRNHSFEDVFGEPDSNVAWDGNRLIQFRCLDGSVQLEVVNQGDITVVVGLNTF